MDEFLAVRSIAPLSLVPPLIRHFGKPELYRPAEGLMAAADAAMLVGIPLLLTGEPGTGKTSAGEWLAWKLKARMLSFDVKSGSTGRDLLYGFDEVARFRDGSQGVTRPQIDYVQFNALGEAIIRAAGGRARLTSVKPAVETAQKAFGIADADAMVAASLLPGDADFAAADPEHVVVLIDEMDKAPRDTPNDLLGEIDRMAFAIPELGLAVGGRDRSRPDAAQPLRPIVIITSNSEKGLPEPFLRRCAFFDIPPPDEKELARIVGQSFPAVTAESDLFRKAYHYYSEVRGTDWVRKKPGTAELLAWIGCIVGPPGADGKPSARADFDRAQAEAALGCVLKTVDDLDKGKSLFKVWRGP